MSEQSLREALAAQLYGEVWSEKPWSEATPQEKALCYKAARRFEQIIAEHGPWPLLNREAVLGVLQSFGFSVSQDSFAQGRIADAVMGLARPMPTREQIAETLVGIVPDVNEGINLRLVIADALLALLNGTEA